MLAFAAIFVALIVVAVLLNGAKRRMPSPRERRKHEGASSSDTGTIAGASDSSPIGTNWHGRDERDQPDLVDESSDWSAPDAADAGSDTGSDSGGDSGGGDSGGGDGGGGGD